MSLGADACRVRTGAAPEVLAAVRYAALWLMRSSRLTDVASAATPPNRTRRCGWS